MSEVDLDRQSQIRIFEAIAAGACLLRINPADKMPAGSALPGKALFLVRDEDGNGPEAWPVARALYDVMNAVVLTTPPLVHHAVEIWTDRVSLGGRIGLVISTEAQLPQWLGLLAGYEIERDFLVLGLGPELPAEVALQLELLNARKGKLH